MPATLTPVPQYDAADIIVPASGDARTAAGVTAPFQTIADRAQFGVNGVASRLQWADTVTVDAGGTSSTFAVHIGAIQTIALARVDGSYRLAFAAAATLTAAHLESGSTLGANEWRYVYAYDPGDGSVAFQISTTAPRPSLAFKVGVEGFLYRYLGCFRTDGASAPIAQRTVRGVTVYTPVVPGGTATASATGPTTGFETLSLASLVPPHAGLAIVNPRLSGDAVWRPTTTPGDTAYSAQSPDHAPIALPADGSRTLSWSSASSGSILVYVRGYHA